jgi:simple sugar transport system permease protein
MAIEATTTEPASPLGRVLGRLISRQTIPLIATFAVFMALYLTACGSFRHFASAGVFIGFFTDNAFLGIAALGATFVILSGGIDLSVGSMVACTGIIMAVLIERAHVHPIIAIGVVLIGGTLFGMAMGALIHYFVLTPFLVTLGGLFILRGIALLVSTESIGIHHPFFVSLTTAAIPLGSGLSIKLVAVVFIAMAILLALMAAYTPTGRNLYAIGGSEPSAVLMGLPVGSAKIKAYTLAGFCSALAGVINTILKSSGDAAAAKGMELDAIAAVVVGGTLLSGGVGYVAGTPLGVLVFAVIAQGIMFQGTLSSWWTKIAIGGLLLGFIVLQRLIQPKKA